MAIELDVKKKKYNFCVRMNRIEVNVVAFDFIDAMVFGASAIQEKILAEKKNPADIKDTNIYIKQLNVVDVVAGEEKKS